MSATISLVTFSGQTVTPKDDAIIYDSAIAQCGIFYGCTVTSSSNVISFDGGYGMIRGRFFKIAASSETVTLSSSGTLLGRVYIKLDLSNSSTPIQIIVETGSTLHTLIQEEDVNFTDGIWEMELATFTINTSTISNLTETYDTISDTSGLIEALQDQIDKLTTNKVTGPVPGRRVAVTTTSGAIFTAPRTGWLQATAHTVNNPSGPPNLQLQDGGGFAISHNWGIATGGVALITSGPVVQGQSYKIVCTRCTLNYVGIYY